MKVSFSTAAKSDLIDIALYIARDNQLRAFSFVDELEAKCLGLGQVSNRGVLRSDLAEGLRMLPFGHYLIFYRLHHDTIRIARVMHGARDIANDDFQVG